LASFNEAGIHNLFFSGSLIMNLEQTPSSDSNPMKPLCSSIIFFVSISPIPVPKEPFVLKKFLKTCFLISSGIPPQLSMTWYSAPQPSIFNDLTMTSFALPLGFSVVHASNAFATRFKMQRCIHSGSKYKGFKSTARSAVRSMERSKALCFIRFTTSIAGVLGSHNR